jgi:hypothetical protein
LRSAAVADQAGFIRLYANKFVACGGSSCRRAIAAEQP